MTGLRSLSVICGAVVAGLQGFMPVNASCPANPQQDFLTNGFGVGLENSRKTRALRKEIEILFDAEERIQDDEWLQRMQTRVTGGEHIKASDWGLVNTPCVSPGKVIKGSSEFALISGYKDSTYFLYRNSMSIYEKFGSEEGLRLGSWENISTKHPDYSARGATVRKLLKIVKGDDLRFSAPVVAEGVFDKRTADFDQNGFALPVLGATNRFLWIAPKGERGGGFVYEQENGKAALRFDLIVEASPDEATCCKRHLFRDKAWRKLNEPTGERLAPADSCWD